MNRETLTDEVRSTYDAVAPDYAAHFPTTEPEQRVDLAMIDHFVSQLTGPRLEVLDAGCGAGRIARYLNDRGCLVHGVDLSPGMIAMAQRDHPDITAQVATITDLPFPDGQFDGALYWYSFIHVTDSDLATVFGEARRVLRPNGVALVAFQVGDGEREVGRGYRKLGHDVTLTRIDRRPDQVSQLLAAAGLHEQARLVRGPLGGERSGQAFVLARATSDGD